MLVGDVEYSEFHESLRHPAWKGLRADVDCGLVTLHRPSKDSLYGGRTHFG